MRTLEELKDELANKYDVDELVEYLGVSSFQLVQHFSDIVEKNFDYFDRLADDATDAVTYLENTDGDC